MTPYTVIALGDSKTASDTWSVTLAAAIGTSTGQTWQRHNAGVSGETTTSLLAAIMTRLNSAAGIVDPSHVLVNVGVNDWSNAVTQATYEANLGAILDAVHARWPSADVWIARPWKQGYDTQANDTAAWIGNVLGARAWASLGMDERVWLKGGDNGATNTSDGIHYSTAGQAACAAAWQTVMGY